MVCCRRRKLAGWVVQNRVEGIFERIACNLVAVVPVADCSTCCNFAQNIRYILLHKFVAMKSSFPLNLHIVCCRNSSLAVVAVALENVAEHCFVQQIVVVEWVVAVVERQNYLAKIVARVDVAVADVVGQLLMSSQQRIAVAWQENFVVDEVQPSVDDDVQKLGKVQLDRDRTRRLIAFRGYNLRLTAFAMFVVFAVLSDNILVPIDRQFFPHNRSQTVQF